ncbi:TonB-dependent receptor family protein [Pseudorhodoferax sp.]|uniref:TonB-dependent receptor family protein n=1 Tax=Pseudorhodoferax sp. TaxID=1993553 RepID=UPI0039E258E5
MHVRSSTPPCPAAPGRCAAAVALALASLPPALHAQEAATLDSIQVTGSWLGTGLQNSVKTFAGARTVVDREEIAETGATSIGDVLRRIPGVQASDNSGTAGSAISLNVGVRGLTGRYSPRSTILLDGVPLAVAPYGQPQLSFAPVSLANIESVDVVRGGGAVRYGPQNVGGIINFTTRAVPSRPGLTGDATLRLNHYGEGGNTALYSAFIGSQLDNGLGLALLYSGMSGRGWRAGSDERVNDLALKWRHELTPTSELYGKVSYYDVRSDTPGGLTVAQYQANPFQNTRPGDYWTGERKGIDVGYVNTLSDDQEFEIRAYYNDSTRASALINAARTQIAHQPRDYGVLGIEPRYTQRLRLGATAHDVTVGYRYLRERGNDRVYNVAVASGAAGATTRNDNATDAHAVYVDDRIAIGAWRITPGLRFEHIASERDTPATGDSFDVKNNKGLPSLQVAYLLNPALTLFANYSTSYGPVQNLQLNSQSATNPLAPEVAKTMEAGARWTQGATSAELTVFKMKFDNQILQVPDVTPTLFRNIGATHHEGIESAVDYAFDNGSALAGLAVYANLTYTRAIQKSGADAGRDVPFYSRLTDTLGARYQLGAWRVNLATTHQSKQYSDTANTEAEAANAGVGRIPGFRLWNLQASWKVPATRGTEVALGVNNLFDKRYYTRNVDGNAGRMVGAPRMVYMQGRYVF